MDLRLGDCREVMAGIDDASIDAIVTDPPYELGFMGKRWDGTGIAYDPKVWGECLRVLKPGGHILAFGGTRTWHRMVVAIEDAGWEVRDSLMWLYGSGFPKSLDVSKAIDKAAGAEREVVGPSKRHVSGKPEQRTDGLTGSSTFRETIGMGAYITAPATDAARQWDGWGTALKPAWEPIVLARKPLVGTVAKNVLEHGTGGMNIDGCRVGTESTARRNKAEMGYHGGNLADSYSTGSDAGRWPANVILDPEAGALLGPEARFFYCAKASKHDRNSSLPPHVRNDHPTVKPHDLMRYLCRLITPPSGLILDPFMGSGSTGVAAVAEGFEFIGIDAEPRYIAIARHRIRGAD